MHLGQRLAFVSQHNVKLPLHQEPLKDLKVSILRSWNLITFPPEKPRLLLGLHEYLPISTRAARRPLSEGYDMRGMLKVPADVALQVCNVHRGIRG